MNPFQTHVNHLSPSTLELSDFQNVQNQSDQFISEFMQARALGIEMMFNNEEMSLEQAEQFLETLINDKIFWGCSALDLLFIESMQTMRNLMKISRLREARGICYYNLNGKNEFEKENIAGQELLDKVNARLHLIFRKLKIYCQLEREKPGNAKNKLALVNAQTVYIELKTYIIELKNLNESFKISETRQNIILIKACADVLHYFSSKPSLLKKHSIALHSEIDPKILALKFPPTSKQVDLYKESLSISLSSMTLYRKMTKNHLLDSLKQGIQNLRKYPHHENLIALLETYQKKLIGNPNDLPSQIEKFIISAQLCKSTSTLKNCLEAELKTLETFEKVSDSIVEMMKIWDPFLLNFELKVATFSQELIILQKSIKEEVERLENCKKTKKNLSEELKFIKKIYTFDQLNIFNALAAESIYFPLIIIRKLNHFSEQIIPYNKAAREFQGSLMQGSPPPCSSFHAIDLFFQLILPYFKHILSDEEALAITMNSMCTGNLENLSLIDSQKNLIENLKKINNNLIIRFSNIASSVVNIGNDSINEIQVNEKNKMFLNMLTTLHSILKDTKSVLKINAYKESKLEFVADSLIRYLDKIPKTKDNDFLTLKRHCFSTLLQPLTSRNEISQEDLPLIQQHEDLQILFIEHYKINEHFIDLEERIKEKILQSSSAEGKYFWKLNLKSARLALLDIIKMQATSYECMKELRACSNGEKVLAVLHKKRNKLLSFKESAQIWAQQLSILVFIADNNSNLGHALARIVEYSNTNYFLNQAHNEIVLRNPLKKFITHQKQIPTSQVHDDKEEIIIEGVKVFQEIVSETLYNPTPLQAHLEMLNTLQFKEPEPLSSEEMIDSYVFRALACKDLLQNSRVYLLLIEESKKNQVKSLINRSQMDHFLLLEATEKIALSFLKTKANGKLHFHAINEFYEGSPLLFSHNGKCLIDRIKAVNLTWFQEKVLQSHIESQEIQLKKRFWFKEKLSEENMSPILTSCEKVCRELVSLKISSGLTEIYSSSLAIHFYQRSRIFELNKSKRGKIDFPFSKLTADSIQELMISCTDYAHSKNIDKQCTLVVQGLVEAIKRVIEFTNALNTCEEDKTPLYYTVRSSEIQISLLSLILQLRASTLKSSADQPHLLFKEEEGRPLIHMHRVDKLWKVLKMQGVESQNLDRYLPLFVGDPRYPFPNKTTLTDVIVRMYEKVYLLQIIEERGFFNGEDLELLKKHLKNEEWKLPSEKQIAILNEKIVKELILQKKKMALAFELALHIIQEGQNHV
ncbi:MAG: hypothetical protein H0V82_08680 [Candidatus Protochlamydia sp.]|nr:hypothetical protein [Candidatus Protochlamydia sp.]